MIYCDNTATSWPKPPKVGEAMVNFMSTVGGNPGRAAHAMANNAARIVYETREKIADFFSVCDPLNVVFTSNITESLNLALLGNLKPGNHVITSSMEHNSMMRPLRYLEKRGVLVSVIPCSVKGFIDPRMVQNAIRSETTLIAINHASNVTGTIQPITEIGKIARVHNLLFCVDTAQSAGVIAIDMEESFIDILCFTGHKSLLGPTGTGGLIIGNRVLLDSFEPLKTGGTGSRSEDELQPSFLPDKYESGTQNVVGLAGLNAGLTWIAKKSLSVIRKHETELTKLLLDGFNNIDEILVYGPKDSIDKTATVSFTINGLSPSGMGLKLDDKGIQCRVGLHCSPSTHKTIGTFPEGTVRIGLGIFNTSEDVEKLILAVKDIIYNHESI